MMSIDKIKQLFITVGIVFFLSQLAFAATETFYVCNGGLGSSPQTDGTCSQAYDISHIEDAGNNDSDNFADGKIGPGDEVLFKDDGGKFRGDWWTHNHNPGLNDSERITFKAYPGDTPIISGFAVDDKIGWTGPDGNGEYYKTYTTQPQVILVNGDKKLYTGTVGSLAADEWGYSGTEVYLNSNPTSYSTLEISQYTDPLAINTSGYHTFDGLTVEGSNAASENCSVGFHIRGGADHIVIQNCVGRWNRDAGARIRSTGGDNNVIQDSTFYGNKVGIMVNDCYAASSGNEQVFRRNTVYDNWHSGIWSSGDYVIVEYNKIYNNGVLDSDCSKYRDSGSDLCDGSGISTFSDAGSDTDEGNNHTIRYNIVYNQKGDAQDGAAILTDVYSDHNEIYGNVAYNNDGACVNVYVGQDTVVYNNSCYENCQDSSGGGGNLSEIHLGDNGTDRTQNVVVKNNAGYATTGELAVYINSNLTDNTGISFDTNLWYIDSGDWWYYGADGAGISLATWNGKSLVGTDLNSDPDYVDVSNGNLSVVAGSPVINAGTDLGASYDGILHPHSKWPDSVSLLDQDDFGNWDIGAYLFSLRSTHATPSMNNMGMGMK